MPFRPLLALFFSSPSASQKHKNTRLNDANRIGWWAGFATFKVRYRWSIHSEYQWRRDGILVAQPSGWVPYIFPSRVILMR
jgi:hypothetical protein